MIFRMQDSLSSLTALLIGMDSINSTGHTTAARRPTAQTIIISSKRTKSRVNFSIQTSPANSTTCLLLKSSAKPRTTKRNNWPCLHQQVVAVWGRLLLAILDQLTRNIIMIIIPHLFHYYYHHHRCHLQLQLHLPPITILCIWPSG